MSPSPNAPEKSPIAEVHSDEEEVVDVDALAQQLREAQLRNKRIARKKKEREDAKVRRLQEEKDKADKLAREEAERKAEKVNKRKRVSAVVNFFWTELIVIGLGLENTRGTIGTGNPGGARGGAEHRAKGSVL